MRVSIVSSLLLFTSLFSLHNTALAEDKEYIVLLGSYPHRSDNTAVDYDHVIKYHQELLGSCLGSIRKAKSSIFYSYNRFINGFAAVLSEEDVKKVKDHPNVISVFLSVARPAKTTNSWNFLGVEKDYGIPIDSAWKKGRFGEDVIIANLDSGIIPESKSFSDEGMGPIPARWRGTCQTNKKDGIKCNRKLIGVRYFNRGYLKLSRRLARRENTTYKPPFNVMTARDYNGHGVHTLSIAGGNFVDKVSVFGQGIGTAKGGSPKARVAAYKVCYTAELLCSDSDILAGFEAAISDGADVISVSLGGPDVELFENGLLIGAFHAVKNGISVVAAGGNSGPTPTTVQNVAPWVLTVGASTTYRDFVSYVTLGNKKVLKGLSLSEKGLAPQKFYPLILGADASINSTVSQNASFCNPQFLDPKKVNGSILVCLQSKTTTPLGASGWAIKTGVAGLIVVNDIELGDDVLTDAYPLPASSINYADGQSIFAYINTTKTPVAHISDVQTEFNKNSSAPMVARFSARGPNVVDPAILKPDVIAPGVNIIAAFTDAVPPSGLRYDNRRVPYTIMSGTSMACPHVSGITGLIKTLHPDWSPAAIKSAIMTTSSPTYGSSHPILDFDNQEATPFALGAGHVNPNSAMDPGLVYDLNVENYLNYLCARGYNDSVLRAFTVSAKPYSCPKVFNIGDFNYPSIVVPPLKGFRKFTRYLKNVGSPGTYNVTVTAPAEVSISIEPSSLKFIKYGEEKKYEINFSPNNGNVTTKDYAFGELVWSDGYHYVRSPIVVKL